MKKAVWGVLATLLLWGGSVPGIEGVAAGKGAELKALGGDKFELSVSPGPGWPQARFTVPAQTWGQGEVELTIKVVEPASGRFATGVSVGTESPRDAINAGYVHSNLKPGETVKFTFKQLGDKCPKILQIALKNPTLPIKLEIGNIKFTGTAVATAPAAVKARLTPIPAVRFKGKPFFPLGAYDTFKIGEAGQFGSIDPRFVAAGGNFADFGNLYLPPENAGALYKKVYSTHGQPAIFKALDEIRNKPEFADVALLVGLGPNIILDESAAKGMGMNNYLAPAVGEALAIRKKVLADAVKKLSEYPNVIGYTLDEPENCVWQYYNANHKADWEKNKDAGLAAKMIEWLDWTIPVIRANHPGAQLMPIIAWWTNYKTTIPLYDVLIANTYPAKRPGMKEFEADLFTVNYDAASQVAAVREAGGTHSAIFMPPMFDILPGSIPLTLPEQLYVMFAPLTRGAMGLHGWRLQRCSDAHRKFVVYPAMAEVNKLKDFFLGEWHDERVTSDRDTASVDYLKKFQERVRLVEGLEDASSVTVRDAVPDVSYCLRRHADGRYLLLAVNNRREPLEATFTLKLDKLPRSMTDSINASDKVYFQGNTAKVKFAPFGVHAYIFR